MLSQGKSLQEKEKLIHFKSFEHSEHNRTKSDALAKETQTFTSNEENTNNESFNTKSAIIKLNFKGEKFATKFKIDTSIREIKNSLVEVLELDKDFITLKLNDNTLDSSLSLEKLGVLPNSTLNLNINLLSEGQNNEKTLLNKIRQNIPTIDVITVHFSEGGIIKDIVVEIEKKSCQKEWLGGYRHKHSRVEYHHAETQTDPRRAKVFEYTESGERIPLLFHRDTQTPFKLKDVSVDTTNNKATQMWRNDLYIQSKTDKIITAKPYKTFADSLEENNITRAVIAIQRSFRSWMHGKRIRSLIALQKSLLDDMKKQKLQILKDQAEKERAMVTSAAYPVKRDDFYMLYLMVGKWWKKEWKRICDLRTLEPRKAESVLLLNKEVKLIENIEKHRIIAKKESLKKERMRFLERSARPITFKSKSGEMISIDSRETQKAREFKEMYSALINTSLESTDRIDILQAVKQLFVSHFKEFEYADYLVEMINREIDLLTMGIKLKDLSSLHKRIEQLFINFLEQKEFNPKAAKYKKPNLPKSVHELFKCIHCSKLLPASKFPVHVRMKNYTECTSCNWLQNISHQRKDMSPYLKLLKQVQSSEMEKCCYTAVCFIFQPIGMAFLTNIVWHGHSAISECNDLSKLQHVRWESQAEWAPWNTILLTDQEAKCHISIPNVFKFYDSRFIENVRQKHIRARKELEPLLKMDHEIRIKGDWSKTTDSGAFLHPSHIEDFAMKVDTEYDKI